MYIEDQYIYEQFNKNFLENSNFKFVLYGTGIHTKILLENVKTDRILGLMDANKTGEWLWGYKVLSYEEVSALENVCIIIIARNAVINIIYRRIQGFVKAFHIPVFTVSGQSLSELIVSEIEKDCFMISEEKLWNDVDGKDIVSFDIFDTLVSRNVLRPADIFRYMDSLVVNRIPNFSEKRMRAESELSPFSNYDIYDIYEQLRKDENISAEYTRELLELEIQVEKRFLMRRESMCSLMKKIKKMGKQIWLISDMYIPSVLLQDILFSLEIKDYDELWVSTDCKTDKGDKLFPYIKEKMGVEYSNWLHIGDNYYSDYLKPRELGITVFKVFSAVEMLEQSCYSTLLENNNSIEENIVITSFANIAYNNPFEGYSQTGKIVINDNRKLAQLLVAPLLVKYVFWLVQQLKKDLVDLVLFPSRDGFILKKMYDEIEKKYPELKLPKGVYFYTSRRATLIAAAQNRRDIRHIIHLPAQYSEYKRMCKRFEINISEECDYEVDTLSEDLYDKLLKISERERNSYNQYISTLGFYENDNVALIDFVAVGTIHEALQRMTGKELNGYYFLRRSPDSEFTRSLNCKSMYPIAGDFQTGANIYKFYYFLENIASSYEPTFKRIMEDGSLDFFDELRENEAVNQLVEIHNAIIEYYEKLIGLFPDIVGATADIKLYDSILGFFDGDYITISEDILKKFINYDEFLGKVIKELNR